MWFSLLFSKTFKRFSSKCCFMISNPWNYNLTVWLIIRISDVLFFFIRAERNKLETLASFFLLASADWKISDIEVLLNHNFQCPTSLFQQILEYYKSSNLLKPNLLLSLSIIVQILDNALQVLFLVDIPITL